MTMREALERMLDATVAEAIELRRRLDYLEVPEDRYSARDKTTAALDLLGELRDIFDEFKRRVRT